MTKRRAINIDHELNPVFGTMFMAYRVGFDPEVDHVGRGTTEVDALNDLLWLEEEYND